MSELSEAINNMRNMREAYDQIGAAAESYNVGKTQLAAAITSKGVETSPTETYPEMAEKVNGISQETYEINGGEMYAKQLFGSLETPNFWNLYEVLANLLSDGRVVQYGGILLAEYYRGYDSIALSGAGSGGAYIVSDKDENGQFVMYTNDTTHVWDTEFDGKCNRWVAYCFASEAHDFQIVNTDTCPRSIHIGRHVGVIESLVNGRVSEIVVTDGNKLDAFKTNSSTQNWNKNLIIRNVAGKGYPMIFGANSELIYIEADNINNVLSLSGKTSSAIILKTTQDTIEKITPSRVDMGDVRTLVIRGGMNISLVQQNSAFCGMIIVDTVIIEDIESYYIAIISELFNMAVTNIVLLAIETTNGTMNLITDRSATKYVYIGYKANDRTKSVTLKCLYSPCSTLTDIELKNGYKKNLNVSSLSTVLTAENIALHMLDRLADNTGEATLTLTIGSTNLNRILADETYAPYVAAAQAKNWTIA